MNNGLMAGVMNFSGYDYNNNLIIQSQTLVESGINFSISSEEARGGQGNALLGRYYHTSSFGLTLTDQIWNMNYLALNCGGAITAGADVMMQESVVVTTVNSITITGDIVNFTDTSGLVGWYKLPSEDDSQFKTIHFIDHTALTTNLPVGVTVCVKYPIHSYAARKFRVNTQFVPSVIRVELTGSLFRVGNSGMIDNNSSKIADIIVKVPQFQFDGNVNLNLSSTSIATVPLTGQALANYTGSCDGQAWYAEIIENTIGAGEFDNVVEIAVADGNINLSPNGFETLLVYKIYNDSTVPQRIQNTKLTFAVQPGKESLFTVTPEGIVTASTEAGEGYIDILVTDKPELTGVAYVKITE